MTFLLILSQKKSVSCIPPFSVSISSWLFFYFPHSTVWWQWNRRWGLCEHPAATWTNTAGPMVRACAHKLALKVSAVWQRNGLFMDSEAYQSWCSFIQNIILSTGTRGKSKLEKSNELEWYANINESRVNVINWGKPALVHFLLIHVVL